MIKLGRDNGQTVLKLHSVTLFVQRDNSQIALGVGYGQTVLKWWWDNGQTVLKLCSVTLFVQREKSHKSNDGG